MALPNLASGTDLSARGVTPTSVHTVMLAVASSVVRAAAGGPISETTSTLSVTGWGSKFLELPGRPIRSVSAVAIDSVAVTDWKLTDVGNLWRRFGWGREDAPVSVSVTMIHGLPAVPAHVVQLVCDLAIVGASVAPDGAHDPRVVAEQIDDYSVTFAASADAVASAMELPRLTRNWLRGQFGGGSGVVTYR